MQSTLNEFDLLLNNFKQRRGEANLKLDLLAEVAESLDGEIVLIDSVIDLLAEERALCELVEFCRTGRYP